MKEEQAITYVDTEGRRHVNRDECALHNMGYRFASLMKERKCPHRLNEAAAYTATLIATWCAAFPLETLSIVEQYVTEKAGPSALPEWLRNKKDHTNG